MIIIKKDHMPKVIQWSVTSYAWQNNASNAGIFSHKTDMWPLHFDPWNLLSFTNEQPWKFQWPRLAHKVAWGQNPSWGGPRNILPQWAAELTKDQHPLYPAVSANHKQKEKPRLSTSVWESDENDDTKTNSLFDALIERHTQSHPTWQ